jgi:hypothetical protein
MNKARHFILCHGWGFDPSFWDPLLSCLQPFGRITLWDLGYFDDEARSSLRPSQSSFHFEWARIKKEPPPCVPQEEAHHPNEEEVIGIGHSFGLMQLLNHPHDFQRIIGIESFLTLHDYRKNALQLLKLVKANPQKGLKAFHRMCASSSFIPPSEKVNPSSLITHLEAMVGPPEKVNPNNLLCFSDVILTDQDPIVPYTMVQEQLALRAPHVKIHPHRGNSHGNLFAMVPMVLDRVTASKTL